MPNATDRSGILVPISSEAYLQIGNDMVEGENPYYFNNVPDLGDSKGATYNDENVIGRAVPIKTFSNGDNRSLSLSINLFVQVQSDCRRNLRILRRIQSAVYPRPGLSSTIPYMPPNICKLKVGSLLSECPICVVMKDYNVRFPTDVPWDAETLCPYRMEISMSFEQVFSSDNLPNNTKILADTPGSQGCATNNKLPRILLAA